jgi:methylated-DNA-[protein]-cysteine S-methyltransferase
MIFSARSQRLSWISPLGPMVLVANDEHLQGVWFEGQAHAPDWQALPVPNDHAVLCRARDQLQAYWAGSLRAFDLPLATDAGTLFQRAVWCALALIPWGQTRSYGELARRIGAPHAVRAVAGAVARNPWSVVVPCHRVVGANGSLTGYAGGLERKAALLALESA